MKGIFICFKFKNEKHRTQSKEERKKLIAVVERYSFISKGKQ